MNAQCFSFCYRLEEYEEYEEDGTGYYGLICTINDAYFSLIKEREILPYLKQFKDLLEKMIGKKVIVLNRLDSEYRVFLEFDEDGENLIEL